MKGMFDIKNMKKLLNVSVLIEILFIGLFSCAVIAKASYLQFTTRLSAIPILSDININMLKSLIGVVLVILSLLLFAFNKNRKAALFAADVYLSLLLFADNVYFRYYYNVLTVPVLYQIGLVGSVGDSVLSLLKIKDLLFMIDLPVLAVILFLLKKPVHVEAVKVKLAIRLAVCVVLAAAGIFTTSTAYYKSDYQIFPFDNNNVLNNMGIMYFHYYDVKRFLKDNLASDRKLTGEDMSAIEAFYNGRPEKEKKYKGIAKGKNLMIVQVEALQEFVINRKFEGREITPNLNRLIKESTYFSNFYYQIGGGNTSDAEFLCNTSLYPLRDGSVYFRYPMNTYPSMPKALKEEEYNTYVMHANNPSFWNRTTMYEALGFDNFFSNKDYKVDEVLGWGLPDLSFFTQSLDKIDTTKPFYSFLITLSSHHPYNFFEQYDNFQVGRFEKSMLGNYLKAANYVDSAVGELIRELKTRGLYDNTVLVIYGDHAALQKDQISDLKEFIGFKDNEFEWNKLQRVPLFIHCPGLNLNGVNDTIGGEIDIYPTVANLLGISCDYALGKDLFNSKNSYAVLRNGNVIAKDFVYINGNETLYDNKGNSVENSNYMEMAKSIQEELLISDKLIKKNAFKKLLK